MFFFHRLDKKEKTARKKIKKKLKYLQNLCSVHDPDCSYSTLCISNNKKSSTDLTHLHFFHSKLIRTHQRFYPNIHLKLNKNQYDNNKKSIDQYMD